jgi:hypothetical protein
MKENCLNCSTKIFQKEGSRERKFCSDSCRASFHQKNNKKPLRDKVPPKWVYDYFKKNPDELTKTLGINDITVPVPKITFSKTTPESYNGNKKDVPKRLEGESIIDYRIRIIELEEKKAPE